MMVDAFLTHVKKWVTKIELLKDYIQLTKNHENAFQSIHAYALHYIFLSLEK